MEKKSKRWVQAALGALIALLALTAGLTYALDPFQRYRLATAYNFRIQLPNYVNPGLVLHSDYDAILVGSSMIENTQVTHIDALFGLDTLKIATKAGNVLHHDRVLEKAFGSHALKAVFYATDVYAFDVDPSVGTGEALPEYLWNDNPWDDISYLLNFDVVTNDLTYVLRQLVRQDAPKLSKDDWYLWEPMTYSREYVLRHFPWRQTPRKEQNTQRGLTRAAQNFDAYVRPFLQAHPDTEFVFYFPPYSQMYWVHVYQEGILETQLAMRAYLAEQMLAYDHVKVYDLSAKKDWILDLDRYTDYSHHLPEMNQEIFDLIAGDAYRVHTVEEVTEHNLFLREIATTFVRD